MKPLSRVVKDNITGQKYSQYEKCYQCDFWRNETESNRGTHAGCNYDFALNLGVDGSCPFPEVSPFSWDFLTIILCIVYSPLMLLALIFLGIIFTLNKVSSGLVLRENR